MNKQEFLAELRKGLSGLPQEDIEECLTFYCEMLDDRIEEGLTEEEAVAAVGDIGEIIGQTVSEIPFVKIAKERIRPKRRLTAGEKVLLALGSPIWLSLGLAAAAVVFSIYIALWAVGVALWAVFGSFVIGAVGSVPMCIFFLSGGETAPGLAILSAGMILAGLSVMIFFGCKGTTKGILILTKKITVWIKKHFIKREEA